MTDRTITTTLVLDTGPLIRAFDAIREAFRPFVEAMAVAARAIGRLAERLRETANDPVRIAGLEARYYVRAGLDPAYRHPERLDALVRDLLAGDYEDDPLHAFVTPENRRALAVAAIRGWAESYDDPGLYVAHRLWATTRVEVCCG